MKIWHYLDKAWLKQSSGERLMSLIMKILAGMSLLAILSLSACGVRGPLESPDKSSSLEQPAPMHHIA